MELSSEHLEDLRRARELLESPSLAVKLTDLMGKPIERSVALLPDRAVAMVHAAVRKALEAAQDVALATTMKRRRVGSADRFHKLAGVTSGAVGGFFGLAGVAVELPLTTVIMLRSIHDIARSEGHDPSDSATRVACLEVFALGGRPVSDDAAETGYYAVRAALATVVNDAVRHVAQKGVAARGAPVLVQLLERIGARFGIVVQEKVALELFPIVGAVSGALINAMFIDHFQNAARGHFIVRRLEARYGASVVREAYERLKP